MKAVRTFVLVIISILAFTSCNGQMQTGRDAAITVEVSGLEELRGTAENVVFLETRITQGTETNKEEHNDSSITFYSIASGSWHIDVTAYKKYKDNKYVIAQGSASITAVSGETRTARVTLSELNTDKNGMIVFSLHGGEFKDAKINVWKEESLYETLDNLLYVEEEGSTPSSFSQISLPAGSYDIKILNGKNEVLCETKGFRVYGTLTSEYYSYKSDNDFIVNPLAVTRTPELRLEVENPDSKVALNGVLYADVSVTEIENPICFWYLNGKKIEFHGNQGFIYSLQNTEFKEHDKLVLAVIVSDGSINWIEQKEVTVTEETALPDYVRITVESGTELICGETTLKASINDSYFEPGTTFAWYMGDTQINSTIHYISSYVDNVAGRNLELKVVAELNGESKEYVAKERFTVSPDVYIEVGNLAERIPEGWTSAVKISKNPESLDVEIHANEKYKVSLDENSCLDFKDVPAGKTILTWACTTGEDEFSGTIDWSPVIVASEAIAEKPAVTENSKYDKLSNEEKITLVESLKIKIFSSTEEQKEWIENPDGSFINIQQTIKGHENEEGGKEYEYFGFKVDDGWLVWGTAALGSDSNLTGADITVQDADKIVFSVKLDNSTGSLLFNGKSLDEGSLS